MRKADKARRRRAERLRRKKLEVQNTSLLCGGVNVNRVSFGEVFNAELKIAHRLDRTLVLRPYHATPHTWTVYAVAKP